MFNTHKLPIKIKEIIDYFCCYYNDLSLLDQVYILLKYQVKIIYLMNNNYYTHACS